MLRRRRNPEGRMSLADHLRELRRRLVIAGIAIALASVIGWLRYDWLLTQLTAPLDVVRHQRHGSLVGINFGGVTSAFSIKLKVALFVGVIIASPVWLYELWAFIVPGLTRRERRTAAAFIAAAVPLFLLAFGLAFLLPVLLVALNAANVLPARVMLKGWRPAVMLIFVFAAMMTPTPDAWTMIALAMPMVGLYFAAVGIAALLDRRRARRQPDWLQVSDDEASSL